MATFCLVGALPRSIYNFRGDLLKAISKNGYTLQALAAPAGLNEIRQIEALGASYQTIPVSRNSLNPLDDLKTLMALFVYFRRSHVSHVLAYTIKPVIWSGIALRFDRTTKFTALITGLGFSFEGNGFLRRALTLLVSWLYRFSLVRADKVIFQNSDDMRCFLARRIVNASKCHVVSGSGVSVDYFDYKGLPEPPISFLLIARLLNEKGIRFYVDAAKKVKQLYPQVSFKLLGPFDPSPDAIRRSDVVLWQDSGVIEYLGEAEDVRPHIEACHVFVLPSYYGEGLPRTILEAMSVGRPVLTTDNVGCRDTVVSGENGFLVPVKDADALAKRMIWFIEHPDLISVMGAASRKMAEDRYDVHKINKQLLDIMDIGCVSG